MSPCGIIPVLRRLVSVLAPTLRCVRPIWKKLQLEAVVCPGPVVHALLSDPQRQITVPEMYLDVLASRSVCMMPMRRCVWSLIAIR